MKTTRWEFKVTLCGQGKDRESAWNDAVESFGLDPGPSETADSATPTGEEDEEERGRAVWSF